MVKATDSGETQVRRQRATASGLPGITVFDAVEAHDREEADHRLVRRYVDGRTNIAALGVATSEGRSQILATFTFYRRHRDPRARLFLEAEETGETRGDAIIHVAACTTPQRKAYFLASHACLWAGGPLSALVAAMYYQVPVIAWGDSSAREILGECALYWDEWSPGLAAESIHFCLERQEVGELVAQCQQQRYRQMRAHARAASQKGGYDR
jgi:hypothetical protein